MSKIKIVTHKNNCHATTNQKVFLTNILQLINWINNKLIYNFLIMGGGLHEDGRITYREVTTLAEAERVAGVDAYRDLIEERNATNPDSPKGIVIEEIANRALVSFQQSRRRMGLYLPSELSTER